MKGGAPVSVHAIDESIGSALDRVFPAAGNPWRHLGSLAFLFFVTCLATGIYAYIVFDTSLKGAYASGRALTEDPYYFGRLVRGVHRYAADAFLLCTALHLVREWVRGHFRAWRAFSWLSGLALVPLLWIAGLTGFWLAWDQLALWSLTATAEWFAAIPALAGSFARNFLAASAMNDRFFSFVVFLHIGAPLFLLGATWVHCLRLSHVKAWPPATLGAPALGTLAILALVLPVASLENADPLRVGAAIAIDWFYLAPLAFVQSAGAGEAWLVLAAFTMATLVLPWTGRRTAPAAAVVKLEQCNGCRRCAADCPFGAVVMIPRNDGRLHPRQAHVIADLCAACGICSGSCPSSTPFRRTSILATGIDLPELPVSALREQLDAALDAAAAPVIVFTCAQAGLPTAAILGGARPIQAECAAMVPPAFVEYALRSGARGVVLAGCRAGDCEYRLGDRWVEERFAAQRDPVLRPTVPRDRIELAWAGSDAAAVNAAIERLAHAPVPTDLSPPARSVQIQGPRASQPRTSVDG